jgi:hypothetical protein
MKLSGPKLLLHLEGLCLLFAASVAYDMSGSSWWKFGVFFLAPDLSMIGYVMGTKIGAVVYNVAHTYVSVAVVGVLGHWLGVSSLFPLCFIWLAHIGLGRMLGCRLKYSDAFKDTHLGRV